MSTAIEPNLTEPATPSGRGALLTTSVLGAVLILGGFLAGGALAQSISGNVAYVEFARLTTLIVGIASGVLAARLVCGLNPPPGTRGGIFLAIATVIAVFYISRAVGMNLRDYAFGPHITFAVLVGLLFGAYRILTSSGGQGFMMTVEEQGWFHLNGFKKTQGLHLRRYTLIGILLIGCSGAWALYSHQTTGNGRLTLSIPFLETRLPLLPSVEVTIPLLVCAATFWIAFRLVNVPAFADFLIATEAEMNKVSWSTRKRLYQDTIVVLVTVVLITSFLLIVDVFWGWLLSAKYIEVLPPRQQQKGGDDQSGNKPLAW